MGLPEASQGHIPEPQALRPHCPDHLLCCLIEGGVPTTCPSVCAVGKAVCSATWIRSSDILESALTQALQGLVKGAEGGPNAGWGRLWLPGTHLLLPIS